MIGSEVLSAHLDRGAGPRRLFSLVTGVLLFLFPFGLVFNVTGVLVDDYPWTSSVYILLIALATLLSELRARPLRPVLAEFGVLAAFLWGVEWVGVNTGFPFGEYRYTGVLGLLIAGVPAAIPCAWYATVMNSRRIAESLAGSQGGGLLTIPITAGLLTLALDIVLEPMAAMVKNYWVWTGGTVPLQNYVSWVVFTVLAVLLLRKSSRPPRDPKELAPAGALLFALQWVLFVVTGGASGHIVPGLVSGGLLILVFLVRRRKS